MDASQFDVIVVGGGNAGMCAAHAARQRGGRVVVLDKAPAAWRGGNSYFTAGAIRFAHGGTDDVLSLAENADELEGRIEVPAYGAEEFVADMRRVTGNRCDPELTRMLAEESSSALRWMRDVGLRLRLMPERQAYEVDGTLRFWGGLAVGILDGGAGLIEQHYRAARANGIEVVHEAAVENLLQMDDGRIVGVSVRIDGALRSLRAGAVVLAAGGFEADAERRAAHLGERWQLAKVRGTPHNTGEMLDVALGCGAQRHGDWAGCHAIQWDADAPDTGDRAVSNRYSRQSYPMAIVVNRDGRRFLDEGADFRNYTYARYGREVLAQPGGVAAQIFDAKAAEFISEVDYSSALTSMTRAESIDELAAGLGIDRDRLAETVRAYNGSLNGARFDPSIKDGRATTGLAVRKSNWAQAVDKPPYVGYRVACGVTFTFGGLRIDTSARVLDSAGRPLPGLCAAGEMVGGLFYGNYPGGSGLSSGSVFGRRAGSAAAEQALSA